jgi:hypothetical protein
MISTLRIFLQGASLYCLFAVTAIKEDDDDDDVGVDKGFGYLSQTAFCTYWAILEKIVDRLSVNLAPKTHDMR